MKPGTRLFLIGANGAAAGPFKWTHIREWLALSMVAPETPVAPAGADQWAVVGDFPELLALPESQRKADSTVAILLNPSRYRTVAPENLARYLERLGSPFSSEGLDETFAWRLADQLEQTFPERKEPFDRPLISKGITPQTLAKLNFLGITPSSQWLDYQDVWNAIDAFKAASPENRARLNAWETERYNLHPEWFRAEYRQHIDYLIASRIGEALHDSVKRRVTHSSERLTQRKIEEVAGKLTDADLEWWKKDDRDALFFNALRQTFPKCCDGVDRGY